MQSTGARNCTTRLCGTLGDIRHLGLTGGRHITSIRHTFPVVTRKAAGKERAGRLGSKHSKLNPPNKQACLPASSQCLTFVLTTELTFVPWRLGVSCTDPTHGNHPAQGALTPERIPAPLSLAPAGVWGRQSSPGHPAAGRQCQWLQRGIPLPQPLPKATCTAQTPALETQACSIPSAEHLSNTYKEREYTG